MGFLKFKSVFVFFSLQLIIASSSSINDLLTDVFTFASFNVSQTTLSPYDWRFIRVELPPFYSSTSVMINSDVSLDHKIIQKGPKGKLPMVCFREGGPPLPDVSDAALNDLVLNSLNESVGGIQRLQNENQCYTLQKNITFMLTYEQTPPGVYYFGLFNGLGPVRTQSKSVNSGSSYTVSANVTTEGCWNPTVLGQYCNQTVVAPKCIEHHPDEKDPLSLIACGNFSDTICQKMNETEIKSVQVWGITESLVVWGANVRMNTLTPDSGELSMMCYARYNAIPTETAYDYSVDIRIIPLILQNPKVGKWYFKIQPVYKSRDSKWVPETYTEVCYSADYDLYICPHGKTGPRCAWKRYMLEAIPKENSTAPIYYMPKNANVSVGATNFSVESLVTRTFHADELGYTWTYFLANTSGNAAAKHLHFQLTSDKANFYGLFIRYGGLSTIDIWDYCYLNKSISSTSTNHSIFKLNDTEGKNISIYILYAREGLWSIGFRHPVLNSGSPLPNSTMSFSLEDCPNQCSNHGICKTYQAAGGSTSYSSCSCDRYHGGFDCSINVVSEEGQKWQKMLLVFSNAAALLPAFWALWKNAWAESVIFMASGVISAIYHACDIDWWCALRFSVLQFMDFWLSFMAVVSVFVYLALISEQSKRTIHTIVAISTALIAVIDPTRALNIGLVVVAAILALLVGCLQEYYTKHKSVSSSQKNTQNIYMRQPSRQEQVIIIAKRLGGYYNWIYLVLGFLFSSMAAISWRLQTRETYWLWHSLWHVAIYISALLFLCSKIRDKGTVYGATYDFAWLDSSR